LTADAKRWFTRSFVKETECKTPEIVRYNDVETDMATKTVQKEILTNRSNGCKKRTNGKDMKHFKNTTIDLKKHIQIRLSAV
jgi:hypothetical protein